MINKIIEIVRKASNLMKASDLKINPKGNSSNYVTSADVNVQNYLQDNLRKLIPDSSFIGEESDENDASAEFTWVVDPIDGTSNFIRDIGISAISVGLLKWGKPYIGVIYQPYRDEMFWAEIGKGAFLNGNPIKVSDRDFEHSHLCSAMSLYDKKYAKKCLNIIEKVYSQADDLRRLGSAAVELVYLAAGRVELYFEIRVFPWDVAGAAPILLEAGGYIDFMYHKDMPLDKPFPVLAANSKENYDKLQEIVYDEITELPY